MDLSSAFFVSQNLVNALAEFKNLHLICVSPFSHVQNVFYIFKVVVLI